MAHSFFNKKYSIAHFAILASFTMHPHIFSASKESCSDLKKAMLTAVQSGSYEKAHQLLQSEDTLTSRYSHQYFFSRLLDIAIQRNDMRMTELLMQSGAELIPNEYLAPNCHNPFSRAIRENKITLVNTLLDIDLKLFKLSIEMMRGHGLSDDEILNELDDSSSEDHLGLVARACQEALLYRHDDLAHLLISRLIKQFQIETTDLSPLVSRQTFCLESYADEEWEDPLFVNFAEMIALATQYQCHQSLRLLLDKLESFIERPLSRKKTLHPDDSILKSTEVPTTNISPILVQDSEGDTLLYWAIRYNNLAMVIELVSNGAKIRTRDFIQAKRQESEYGNKPLTYELVSRGADYSENNSWSDYLYTLIGQKSRGELFNHRKTIIQETLEDINDMPRDLSRLICTFAAVPERQMPSRHAPESYRKISKRAFERLSKRFFQ